MVNIVLFQPEIPPNTGNIGRLCHAAELQLHLIEPLGFSLDDKSLRRAGLDYWEELDVQTWKSYQCWQESLAPSARCFYFSTKATVPYWEQSFRDGDYLVFGPETRGLPESILEEKAETCLTIPQRRGRSLNLSTAVGIVAYECLRQFAEPEKCSF